MSRLIFALLAFLIPTTVMAAACPPETEIGLSRRIDGPANIREQPNDQSRIIASLPNRSMVTIVSFAEKLKNGKTQIWYYVKWTQSGQTFQGWTHTQNIVCD